MRKITFPPRRVTRLQWTAVMVLTLLATIAVAQGLGTLTPAPNPAVAPLR